MNALTEQQKTALGNLAGLAAGLSRATQEAPRGSEGEYLKFGKDGLWSMGAANTEVAAEDQLLIDVEGFAKGFASWTRWEDRGDKTKKNTKVGERMLPLTQGAVDQATLPDTGWDWAEQVSFTGRFINEPLAGKVASYESTSYGGRDAFGALTAAVLQRLQNLVNEGREPSTIYPVVSLAASSYIHKKHGKLYTPVFSIVAWADKAGRIDGEESPQKALPGTGETPPVQSAEQVGGPVTRRRR